MKPMLIGKRAPKNWAPTPKLRTERLASDVKPFDIGVYTFKRTVGSLLCPPDDKLAANGQTFVYLYPFSSVDPKGLYCFGVGRDGNVKTLVKANLQFRKVVTLTYHREPLMTYMEETQAKLLVAISYSLDAKQLTI